MSRVTYIYACACHFCIVNNQYQTLLQACLLISDCFQDDPLMNNEIHAYGEFQFTSGNSALQSTCQTRTVLYDM